MTAPVLHCDFETRSELDLKEVGLWNYVRHPSTDIWCMAHAQGGCDEVQLWHPNTCSVIVAAMLGASLQHVADGGAVYAHNAPFELAVWNEICVPRYGWPRLAPEQTYCTMAMCYAMGLPGSLEDSLMALGADVKKDMEGRALMLKYARPWTTTPAVRWMDECPQFTLGGRKWTGQEGLHRLYDYCKQDIRGERELCKRLVPLSDKERRVWLLDYKINQRGVCIDLPSVKGAIDVAEKVKEQAGQRLAEITGGAVQAATALPSLKQWLADRGVSVGGLAKQDVADLLGGVLPDDVRAALTIRSEAGKASVAKFDVMARQVGADGRLHNMYQYHGAGTGRWAGRAVQTHNLVRDMPKPEVVETVLSLVREGNHEAIDMLFGPPLSMVSRSLRSFFVAPDGKLLISGDFANVEGRGQAWFAGEQWKLDAFRLNDTYLLDDNGNPIPDKKGGFLRCGPGTYELMASMCFGIPIEQCVGEIRQRGKVLELAFGYQGGVGSGRNMGKVYGVKATDEQYNEWKELWRDRHLKIAGVRETRYSRDGEPYQVRVGGIWKQIQAAAISAVRQPGESFAVGHPGREARYKMVGSFLWCLLPSGRAICFPYPKVLEGEYGPQLTYMSKPGQNDDESIIYDSKNTNTWARFATYGGALFNRIVQGFCRDLLVDSCLMPLDEAGAAIVLHTHDDGNIEVDAAKAEKARAAMERMMRTPPPWAAGFPLYAECKIMRRYGK